MHPRIPLPADLAGRPFTYSAGLAAGLGPGRLRGPDLQTPFFGVRHPSPVPLTITERCWAFQQRMPADAFFSSVTAARVMGVPLPSRHERDALLHVAVPSPRRALAARGIVGHKVTLIGDDVRLWRGLRISSPERAWCELSAVLPLPALVAAGDFLVQWRLPLSSIEAIGEAVTRYPARRRRAVLLEALGLLHDRSESPKESELRVILVRAGIAGLEVNYPIPGTLYRGDLAIPGRKTVLEYQGEYHLDPERWQADLMRISRLQAVGWLVVQLARRDLDDPVELVARIRAILASRPVVS